jgi:Matrixin/Putative peptidoglycan binding domain
MSQQPLNQTPNGEVASPNQRQPRWKAPTVKEVAAQQGNGEACDQVVAYLKRFGHVDKHVPNKTVDLSTALTKFQRSAGLKETGLFDEATEARMQLPRCGLADKSQGGVGGVAQFVHGRGQWNHTNLTYRFDNFTPDLSPSQVRTLVQGAFARWAAVTPLTFTEVTSGEDITIRFVTGDHGDGNPFDGPGNVLAHAWYPADPLSGDTHFDEDEEWTEFQLGQVALHELGHALGLDHSTVAEAVMWPFFDGTHPELHEDDMAGIHSLYGFRSPRWELLDNNSGTTNIIALSNDLYQFRISGQLGIWKYIGPPVTGWQLIDNDPSTLQIAGSVGGDVYRMRSNGDVSQYLGSPLNWSLIDSNRDTVDIQAGGFSLFQRHREGAIYRFAGLNATPRWELIDNNPLTEQITAGGNGQLYQRHTNGDLWRYIGPTGINWELIENGTGEGRIVAAGDKLYQRSNRNIWEWSWPGGGSQRRTLLDNNLDTVDISATGTHLYQIHGTGRVWRYTGIPMTGWELLDDFSGSQVVVGSDTGDVFQKHANGEIWRLVS